MQTSLHLEVFLLVAMGMVKFKIQCGEADPDENAAGSNQPGVLQTGQANKIDVENHSIKDVAHIFSQLWNRNNTESNNFFRVSYIQGGTSQVVSGVIYNITVLLTETECAKEKFNNVKLADLISDAQKWKDECPYTNNELKCWFKLHSQPWADFIELISYHCEFNM